MLLSTRSSKRFQGYRAQSCLTRDIAGAFFLSVLQWPGDSLISKPMLSLGRLHILPGPLASIISTLARNNDFPEVFYSISGPIQVKFSASRNCFHGYYVSL